jgi:hypothetical protein
MHAADAGQTGMVPILLRYGADPALEVAGETAADLARGWGYIKAEERLSAGGEPRPSIECSTREKAS